MKYSLTLKGLELTPVIEKIIIRNHSKLERKLHNFAIDIPEVSIFIKKHDKNHFFSGMVSITLPKKKLIAKIGGHEVTDILHEGFTKINKAFEAYKAKHFKGSSKYPYHITLAEKDLDV